MHISCSAQRCGILPAGNSTIPETPCVSALRSSAADRRSRSSVFRGLPVGGLPKPKLAGLSSCDTSSLACTSMDGDACIMITNVHNAHQKKHHGQRHDNDGPTTTRSRIARGTPHTSNPTTTTRSPQRDHHNATPPTPTTTLRHCMCIWHAGLYLRTRAALIC